MCTFENNRVKSYFTFLQTNLILQNILNNSFLLCLSADSGTFRVSRKFHTIELLMKSWPYRFQIVADFFFIKLIH